MQTNLDTIKKKLADQTELLFFVSVRNAHSLKLIEQITGATIREHGSIEKYLHTLHTKGIKEVILEPRKRMGTSSKKCGTAITLKLNSTGATPIFEAQPETQHQNMGAMPGLMGGQIGLGQYMEAHASMRALQKLEQDHAELKQKHETLLSEKERLKDENVELKRTNDRLEDKIERKGPLDGIDINQALPALIGLLKQAPSPGLNAPQQKQLTPIKEAMRQSIEQETMPDEIVQKLYKILERYIDNDEIFVNQFESLINQSNLKPVKNA